MDTGVQTDGVKVTRELSQYLTFVEPPFSFFFATNLTESVVVVLYLNEDTEI